jgi:hypothetical protein
MKLAAIGRKPLDMTIYPLPFTYFRVFHVAVTFLTRIARLRANPQA